MADSLTFVQASDSQLDEYDALADRSYAHRVADIGLLRRHADVRVALHDGRVVAGGLGFLIPQFFGGQPIPSACLGAGCVAPEERGRQLIVRMLAERIRVLQERGAVLATLWTNSNGYGRRVGWESPAQVFTWSVPAEELMRSFSPGDFDIAYGLTAETERLQRDLAQQWNGPLSRPAWWAAWQQEKYRLTSYQFGTAGKEPSGFLSFTPRQVPGHAAELVVQDFWASDHEVASAMLSFLGRHNSTVATIVFERTSLPPYPVLLHNLHRNASATAHAKPGWMLRILDLEEAVRLRGWPADLNATIPIEIGVENTSAFERYALRISAGTAELTRTAVPGQATFTRRQFAVWYAGGYRTVASARLSGVQGAPQALDVLIRATADREPWMPDHF